MAIRIEIIYHWGLVITCNYFWQLSIIAIDDHEWCYETPRISTSTTLNAAVPLWCLRWSRPCRVFVQWHRSHRWKWWMAPEERRRTWEVCWKPNVENHVFFMRKSCFFHVEWWYESWFLKSWNLWFLWFFNMKNRTATGKMSSEMVYWVYFSWLKFPLTEYRPRTVPWCFSQGALLKKVTFLDCCCFWTQILT